MALSAPELLAAYDDLYRRLTREPRALDRHAHETVWMAVLAAVDESLGTHHIPRYLDAGGSESELTDILALTALARGAGTYRFVHTHWRAHLPGLDPESAYGVAFERAAGGLPLPLAHTAAAAVHMCLAQWEALAWQLKAAYRSGASEAGLAEALSTAMFPGSVPYFARAAAVWRGLIVGGEVDASAAFRAWAKIAGQGGYDEAAGLDSGSGP